ncbi:unnamed protein product, partial [Ectocarpus sp. 8 AP-2014]
AHTCTCAVLLNLVRIDIAFRPFQKDVPILSACSCRRPLSRLPSFFARISAEPTRINLLLYVDHVVEYCRAAGSLKTTAAETTTTATTGQWDDPNSESVRVHVLLDSTHDISLS